MSPAPSASNATGVEGSDTILIWYEVFAGGCATIQLRSAGHAPEMLAEVTAQASHVIGFVARRNLAQALDERSEGRLRLDPPP